jgi:hypothetical protein
VGVQVSPSALTTISSPNQRGAFLLAEVMYTEVVQTW